MLNLSLPAEDCNTQTSVHTASIATVTQKESLWLSSRLERGKTARFTEVVIVTPGRAAAMLKLNLGNRSISPAQVKLHIDRLKRGDFILTHQGIAFSREGTLNDGQHRLTAIRDSGIEAMMQVTFGADRAEFSVVDQGSTRGADQILGMMKYTNVARRAALAKALLTLNKGHRVVSDKQVVVDYAVEIEGPDFRAALKWGEAMKKVTNPTSASLAHYTIAMQTRHPAKAAVFFDGIATGENLSGVRLRLREWLTRGEMTSSNGVTQAVHRAAAIINTYNSFVQGKKTVDFKHTSAKLPAVL